MLITRWDDPATLSPKLRFEDAHPHEQIVRQLVDDVIAGTPWAELTGEPFCWPEGSKKPELPGSVLTLHDDFGHCWTYKIVGYNWSADTFALELLD